MGDVHEEKRDLMRQVEVLETSCGLSMTHLTNARLQAKVCVLLASFRRLSILCVLPLLTPVRHWKRACSVIWLF